MGDWNESCEVQIDFYTYIIYKNFFLSLSGYNLSCTCVIWCLETSFDFLSFFLVLLEGEKGIARVDWSGAGEGTMYCSVQAY